MVISANEMLRHLAYKPDAEEACRRMQAYWAGDMIDRPCISLMAPRDGVQQPVRPWVLSHDFKFEEDVTVFEEWAEATFFGGEAFPYFYPWYGPNQWAAFVGAPIKLEPEMGTSWTEPFVEDWQTTRPLKITTGNPWWNGVLCASRVAARRGAGRYLVCTIDNHSGFDCLAAIRGTERLCMDLIDHPEHVMRAAQWLDDLYRPVYDAIYEAGRMPATGTTSWADMWSDGRTQVVQCDFSCMVSSDHFRRFILPSLEREISYLDHAVYHLDGVDAIRHLDDLLAIPHLHTIQWVPGDGAPQAPAWLEMLQRIQRAGKSVQILVTPDELKAVHPHLDPARVFYWVNPWSPVCCYSEKEARDLVRWLEQHS